MKTFVITLQRAKERSRYIRKHLDARQMDCIYIDAVDGNLLTEKDIAALCNMEQVAVQKRWLTKGAIGCALSHLKAYQEFLKTDGATAFIVEDDAVLPANIKEILHEVEKIIRPFEVVMLYCVALEKTKLSTRGKTVLATGNLYYPMDITRTLATTAYVIGREAAQRLSENIIPVNGGADSWDYFYEKKCIRSMKVYHPSPVRIKNFKSSIDYLDEKSFAGWMSEMIDRYRLPGAYQLVGYRRKKRLQRQHMNFTLTDEWSPIYLELKNAEVPAL